MKTRIHSTPDDKEMAVNELNALISLCIQIIADINSGKYVPQIELESGNTGLSERVFPSDYVYKQYYDNGARHFKVIISIPEHISEFKTTQP